MLRYKLVGYIIVSTIPRTYQSTTYMTSLLFLMCLTIQSTIYAVSSVNGLYFEFSLDISDKFSLSVGCIPVVGTCVTRSMVAVIGISWSSMMGVFG